MLHGREDSLKSIQDRIESESTAQVEKGILERIDSGAQELCLPR